MINDRPAGALTGFKWNQGDNPHGIPTAQQFCFRDALCTMKGWPPGSDEWLSIQPGPPETDLERLVREKPELGLEFHGEDEHVSGETEGIVFGTKSAMVLGGLKEVGHAAYSKRIGEVADQFRHIRGVISRKP